VAHASSTVSASARTRARAAKVVADVAARGRSLDAALASHSEGTAQERGLLKALSYDSIRWYLRLDALLDRLLSRPGQKLDPDVRALALVGLCQLLYTDIPPHAAVAETVDAARAIGHPRAAGLINALLRRCQREQAELLPLIDAKEATRVAHPKWLLDALRRDWGDTSAGIVAANNERPPFWIRVNRRRVTADDYAKRLEELGIRVAASLFDGEALRLEQAMDVAELPGFAQGLVSVQDAAAQLAARLLSAAPGDRVLDACAAPGGKTGHLLELQPELERLVAVDVSRQRLARVEENLGRLGLQAELIAADAAEPAQWWDGRSFHRILLDVPCSATGVIRRHPDIKLLRRAQDIPELAARQMQLLDAAWSLLEPGGRLVFASCSALAQETHEVVAAFLATHSQAQDVSAACVRGLGFAAQAGPGHRIAAGTAGMDGFYYACLNKPKGR
jgi:16S rRNA (cytosine967-C5)-methyltransferase